MYLYTAFPLSKLCPPKHLQTEVDGRGVESINIATEFEDVFATSLSCLANEVESELLKDAIIPILICSCE